MATHGSDSEELTDIETLEAALNLRPPPTPPSPPVPGDNGSASRASPPSSSTSTSATSRSAPAPSSTRSQDLTTSSTSSSTPATSRPRPSSSTRRAAAPTSRTRYNSSKRPRRSSVSSASATTDDEAARGAGAVSGRGARTRKRATRQRSERSDEGAGAPSLPPAELERAAEPASSATPARRRVGPGARSLAAPPPAQAQQRAPRMSRELRMLKRDCFSQDPSAADSLRATRIAALSRASPHAERTEVQLSPELEAPSSSGRVRRSSTAATALGELATAASGPRPGPAAVVDAAAAPPPSQAQAYVQEVQKPQRLVQPAPLAGPRASAATSSASTVGAAPKRSREDAQLSKKQRKTAPASSSTGAAPGPLAIATGHPPSSFSLASILNPALDTGSAYSSASSASPSALWPTPVAAVAVVAPNALPARRLSKPPKRFGHEVVERQPASSSTSRTAPGAPPAPSGARMPGDEEVGRNGGVDGRCESFMTLKPLVTGSASMHVEMARSPILISPQDPSSPFARQNLPGLPPLPAAPPSTAPVASTSSAPPPPPRLAPTSSSSSTKVRKVRKVRKARKAPEAPKAPKEPKERLRHPALDSRDSWVPVERDLRMTAAGMPPIWCQGRQELCESVPYFRSYQGGHYDSQERCLGYLLDGFPSPSDACASQGKVIVSHGGGGSEVLAGGGTRLKADQSRVGVRVRALLNCMNTGTPVVLLAGAMYEHFPKLKHMGKDGVRYTVLGHYLVTDVWAEGEPTEGADDGKYFVRFKVRFEWLASQGEPWFAEVIGKDESSVKIKSASPELRAPSLSPELHAPSLALRSSAALAAPSLPRLDAPSSAPPPPRPTTSTTSASSNPLAGLHFKRIAPVPPLHDAGSDMDMSSDDSDSSPPSPRSSGSYHTVDSGFVDTTTGVKDECGTCGVVFNRVYCEDVECYNEKCDKFFLVDGKMPRPGSLTYRPSFLGLTSSLSSSDLVPQQLAPRTMQTLSGTSQISDYSELAWRGFGCSMCGRLSSRSQWTRLVCAGCGAVTDAAARPVGAVELEAKGKGRALEPGPDFIVAPCEPTPITGVRGYDGYSVDLSPSQGGGTARVHHLWPVGPSASEFGDKLFKEYQGPEAGALFRRNTLSRHHATGALLCQQFTFNSGERYSHVVSMETYPFPPHPSPSSPRDEPALDSTGPCAPQCTLDARDYLKTVVRSVVGSGPETDFNEILSVAYMTGGKMNYHDDGESGLGQYVASISLGSDALMTFRAKVKKQPKKGTKADDEGGVDAEDEGDEGKKDTGNKSRIVLKTRLKHGHVLIMEGADMQKLFEHKVEPEGLRFAATARWVGPDHFKQPQAPKMTPSSRLANPGTATRTPSTSRPRPCTSSAPRRSTPVLPHAADQSALAPPASAGPSFSPSLAPHPPPPTTASSSSIIYSRHPDAGLAAHLNLAPHDKRVRDTPRAHPRGSAVPRAQLLPSSGSTPTHGVPIPLPTAPPDVARGGSTGGGRVPQPESAPRSSGTVGAAAVRQRRAQSGRR